METPAAPSAYDTANVFSALKLTRVCSIPLSGEFHLLMAEMAGNSLLTRMLRELENLTCLIIILYDSPNAQSCPYDDHLHLVEAISRTLTAACRTAK
jgi:DNA-binding GntR family transcriptional regulator